MIKSAPMKQADTLATRPKRQRSRNDLLLGLALIAPAVLLVTAVLIYPTVFNLAIAMREWNWSAPPGADKPFVGFDNFITLFQMGRFWNSFRVTMTLVIVAVIVQYLLGLLLALMLNKKFHGQRIFRAIFVLPMVLAPIVIGIQWRYLLSGNFGVINYVLGAIGIDAPRWLSDPKLGLPILITVDTWTWLPFVTLILLAGLQQVPQEVLEAAEVDGASYLTRLWYIVLPFLRPATVIVLLMRSTEIFRAFVKAQEARMVALASGDSLSQKAEDDYQELRVSLTAEGCCCGLISRAGSPLRVLGEVFMQVCFPGGGN